MRAKVSPLSWAQATFWGNGLRIWLATSVAVFAAFWLQLDSPSTAAVTVAILAQPRRGHALSRAIFRLGGTIIGGCVAILLIGAFGQERVLLLTAFTMWLGACVFVAAYLPGSRAYGAVLSGYTVAMIVIANMDVPQNVFMETFERVAAICVGIASITLINVVFQAPEVNRDLSVRLDAATAATYDFVKSILRGASFEADATAKVLRGLVTLRDDTALISVERLDGANREAGARNALSGLSAMVANARPLSSTGAFPYEEQRARLRRACLAVLDREPSTDGESIRERPDGLHELDVLTPPLLRACQNVHDLLRADVLVQSGLTGLRSGSRPCVRTKLPLHRDFPVAIRDALRIMIAFGLSATFFIACGCPATSFSLALVATLCALSATTPSPSGFAMGAIISFPMAVVASGVTRFFILDQSQNFFFLAVLSAPLIFVASYLMSERKTMSIGLLFNIFWTIFLAPSNPQTYDLQAFINTVELAGMSVILLFLTSRLVLPVTVQQRMRWLLMSARRRLALMINGRRSSVASEQARADDRVAQYLTSSETGARLHDAGLVNMFSTADLAVAFSTINQALPTLGRNTTVRRLKAAIWAALRQADTSALSTHALTVTAMLPGLTAEKKLEAFRLIAGLTAVSNELDHLNPGAPADRRNHVEGVKFVMDQVRKSRDIWRTALRYLATGIITAAALVGCLFIWDIYVTTPWTRDGRVRVQVVGVAPRVAGQITEVEVVDNQYVHKGELLYVIDPFDYAVALSTTAAALESKEADLEDKRDSNVRRQLLTTLSTSTEEKSRYDASFRIAAAAVKTARADSAQAQINIQRTQVTSPVNGYVTNLLLRSGDYATVGSVNISLVDADSYWIDGYFEETKLGRIEVGSQTTMRLMGYSAPLSGVVESVTRGISSAQAAPGTQGLPDVDPVYTWVRLAQRIPIRIRITHVPAGVPLVAGMTCTVTIAEPPIGDEGWLSAARHKLAF